MFCSVEGLTGLDMGLGACLQELPNQAHDPARRERHKRQPDEVPAQLLTPILAHERDCTSIPRIVRPRSRAQNVRA